MGLGSDVVVSCGIGQRFGSDPALLWLWLRPAAAVPIPPLAWELSYGYTFGPIKQKKKKKKSHPTVLNNLKVC